ncbi:hypothetical protein FFK22_013550 [Mycobacterium sp. KBS0706]|uniref:hypothetical protein n=1 Tax=Mycobacterium sp. KBS0706 TaxID=2578109 RepID=UPI00110FB9CA|nr:hypothetical protein [Mycobacterium sp. KBS0706]TSD88252.1 hypothetical protein FFK22_013550 [Mycobacterium sp. KBS0706]
MLTRLAEIAMQLAEAEGVRAVAAQARAAAPKAGEATVQAARAEAQEAGRAFSRFSNSVQRSLAQRARAAGDLCARDKADRRARRARQRNHVTDALHALIWAPDLSTEEHDKAEERTNDLQERLNALYADEDDRVEDRPVGAVIAGLACSLELSDEWRRRASDWSDPPCPPPPAPRPDCRSPMSRRCSTPSPRCGSPNASADRSASNPIPTSTGPTNPTPGNRRSFPCQKSSSPRKRDLDTASPAGDSRFRGNDERVVMPAAQVTARSRS